MKEIKVTWILEHDVFDENLTDMHAAIQNEGCPIHIWKYLDFVSRVSPADNLINNGPLVFYGSLNFAKLINKNSNFVPGAICTLNNFKCSTYYKYFGKYLLNGFYTILPIPEAIRLRDHIFNTFSVDDCVFVRPDDGDKPFKGKIIKYKEFTADGFEYGYYYNDPNLPILISSPKVIQSEYRLFTDGREALAGSSYITEGKRNIGEEVPKKVLDFAKKVLGTTHWRPDPVFCMDFCLDGEENPLLIEINSFSCSGFYNSDPVPIIKRVNEIARETYNSIEN
jgi:hypothetical protein